MTITAPVIPMPPLSATDEETIVVKRKPGRPKKLRPRPTASQEQYERSVAEARERAMAEDGLLGLLQSGHAEAGDVLWAVVEQLAVESANLRWNREHAESGGTDTQRISSRRVEALVKIADLVCAGRKQGLFALDHRAAKMADVEALWISNLHECATEVLGPKAESFIARMRQAMEEWQDKIDPAG